MTKRQHIVWFDVNRFDTKPDKSTWLEVSKALAARNFAVSIVTSYSVKAYSIDEKDIRTVNIRPSRVPGLFRLVFLYRSFWAALRIGDSDAIYILSPSSLLLAPLLKLSGRKKLHLDVRTLPVSVHGFRRKLDKFVFWNVSLSLFARFAKTYSFITQRLQEEVESLTGVRYGNVCIWSSGVQPSFFENSIRPLVDGEPYHFFYHGTITEDRGIISIIEALRLVDAEVLDRIFVDIVGSGPGVERMQATVKMLALQGKVLYHGLVSYKSIPTTLSLADCCICPLPDRLEWRVSSPIKIFEYMAAAKPVIATRIAAHVDVLEGKEFVVWVDDAKAASIAAAMERAYWQRSDLAEAARSGPSVVASKYTWDLQGERLATYLKQKYG